MQQIHFSIVINAPIEKVWHTMLDEATYQEWTAPFAAGSRYVGDWNEGSKIKFFADHEGEKSGMVALIAANRPYEYISIEHLGMVEHGVEDTTSEQVQPWAGAHENYTFKEVEGGTEVVVDMDVVDEYKDTMEDTWPKALAKLKAISES